MARRVYFGNSSSSRRVKGIYLGISGSSRKVIKGYIGVGGHASLFYPQYKWNKYSVKTITTYNETRGNEVTIDRAGGYGGYSYWNCYTAYAFDTSTGKYSYSGYERVTCRSGTTYISNKYYNGYEVTSTDGYRWEDSGGFHWVYESELRGKLMGSAATSTESPDALLGTVTALVANAYPTNGKHSDGYWYVAV